MDGGTSAAELIDKLITAIYAGLGVAGKTLQGQMVSNLEAFPVNDTGRLKDSIAFATTLNRGAPVMAGSNYQEEDKIEAPETPYTMAVGTVCPYAAVIEHGSTAHKSAGPGVEGKGSFDERIRAWALRHGISDENVIFLIKRKIARDGLVARPFVAPVRAIAQPIVQKAVQAEVDKILKGFIKGKVTIDVTMSM